MKEKKEKPERRTRKTRKAERGGAPRAVTASALFDVTPASSAAAAAAAAADGGGEAMEDRVALLVARGYDDGAIADLLEDAGYVARARPTADLRRGFSAAEIAARRWRRRRSTSTSASRSRSLSRERGVPADPRQLLDRLRERGYRGSRDGDARSEWDHDFYDAAGALPDPAPNLPERYEPPQPEWFSRAGGVYIPNPRAWLNEPRDAEAEERAGP